MSVVHAIKAATSVRLGLRRTGMIERHASARRWPLGFCIPGFCISAAVIAFGMAVSHARDSTDSSYSPSWQESGRLEAFTTYSNPTGKVGVLLQDGPVDIANHPFFRPVGPTGRSCATCHEPEAAMGLSLDRVRERWSKHGAKDPLFAAIDGTNCPNLPAGEASSHSLLLNRGLIRMAFPWPPRDVDDHAIAAEFTLEVVRDPTGCNKDPEFGLNSVQPRVSVYRRPRIAANLRYILNLPNNREFLINVKTGFALPRDPESNSTFSMNLMADGRIFSLKEQHAAAIEAHIPGAKKLTDDEMDELLRFARQIYAAQVQDELGGDLIEEGGPAGLGPFNLARADTGLSGEALNTPVFQPFDQWKAKEGTQPTSEAEEFRASVARGADLFLTRTFLIRDVNHINSIGLGNPVKRSCALCHNAQMTGHDGAPGWMDIGITNWPWAAHDQDLPLFKLTCRNDAPPHPYLGRVIYTTDPGRALVTGRCSDIGSLTMQQFRGLAARAPYFNNGSVSTLREVVDFYDRRFNIGYTDREKQDLVNFLRVL